MRVLRAVDRTIVHVLPPAAHAVTAASVFAVGPETSTVVATRRAGFSLGASAAYVVSAEGEFAAFVHIAETVVVGPVAANLERPLSRVTVIAIQIRICGRPSRSRTWIGFQKKMLP